MSFIRQPAVAGAFYPGTADALLGAVRGYLRAVEAQPATAPPKAIVAPHAGYIYSGSTAGLAYALLRPFADIIRRVVLLGPCHRIAVRGLALSGADAFATPLGPIALDKQAAALIEDLPQVGTFEATHSEEHSLEVQLPFLQEVLSDFSLVPLVVGAATPSEVAEVLERLWGGPETLIVVSSDLSHYLDYETARRIDGQTCRAVESLDGDAIGDEQACGRIPLKGLLLSAKRRGMRVETVGLCNSGDTAGDKFRVVGYGAWAFYEQGADERT